MKIVEAPKFYAHMPRPWVFLAGSVEMGAAEDWQNQVIQAMTELPGTLLNPRRDDWDASWKQTIENENFHEQVMWELTSLDSADYIFLYFDPKTKSPISLLEFGLFYDKKMVVICPEGFWRRGNLEIVCSWKDLDLLENLEDGIGVLTHLVNTHSEVEAAPDFTDFMS